MKMGFDKLSIRGKLILIVLTVTFSAMAAGFGVVIVHEVIVSKKQIAENAALIARTVANYSVSDLEFNDAQAAEQTLAQLDGVPNIIDAFLFDDQHTLFASKRDTSDIPLLDLGLSPHSEFKGDLLHVIEPVHYGGRDYGHLYLLSSTAPLKSSIRDTLLTTAALALLVGLLAWVLAARLQGFISGPILRLAGIAERISQRADYSERATSTSDDEIGSLCNAFNTMLSRIEARDTSVRRAEAQFRGLLETAPDGMVIVDESGTIRLVNEQTERLFGYKRDELIGQGIEMLLPEPLRSAHQQQREAYGKAPVVRQMGENRALQGLRKDGSTFPVEISLAPLQTEAGLLISADVRDITERRHAEAELEQYRDHLEELVQARTHELESANKELEAFSYSISHDLRTPLRSIDGFSHFLLEDYGHALDDTGRGYLERVRQAAQRMATLIDDLLQLSRVNRHNMARTEVDLHGLAEDVVGELVAADAGRDVTINIAAPLIAECDATLMRQVLANLLGNAWKFTARNAQASIEFARRRNGEEDVYYVRDNGVGFDMQYSDKLFGVFERLHTDMEFSGTGVGLATVQRIIQRHGGRIWAEAALDEGATFFFTLDADGTTT